VPAALPCKKSYAENVQRGNAGQITQRRTQRVKRRNEVFKMQDWRKMAVDIGAWERTVELAKTHKEL
jgi:hypothetical protein